jgi:hypothetical protein
LARGWDTIADGAGLAEERGWLRAFIGSGFGLLGGGFGVWAASMAGWAGRLFGSGGSREIGHFGRVVA